MTEQDSCRSCVQKHECQRVYEQIGNTSGSSVAVKVSLAFLLPLVVFIVGLAASQRVLAGVAEPAQTAISLALALASALGCILAVRVISGKSWQDR